MKPFEIKPFDNCRMQSGPKATPCGMMGHRGDNLLGGFWPDVIEQIGLIGFYAERYADSSDGQACNIGHLIFFPKSAARKLAYPTCTTNHNLEKTLYLWCLNGLPMSDSLEHVDALVKKALSFARENGYTRFETCSAASGSQQHNEILLKNGFKPDESIKHALSARGMEPVKVLYWEVE